MKNMSYCLVILVYYVHVNIARHECKLISGSGYRIYASVLRVVLRTDTGQINRRRSQEVRRQDTETEVRRIEQEVKNLLADKEERRGSRR
jgi:hypothetical protein